METSQPDCQNHINVRNGGGNHILRALYWSFLPPSKTGFISSERCLQGF